ncbi:hypothetical protein VTI74DRAFT_3513 [Chaetomium olivicolor]
MDTSFHAAVPGGIGLNQNSDGHESNASFHPASYSHDLSAAGHDVPATQSLGNPMDVDFDFDVALWAWDLDHSANRLEPALELNHCSPSTGPPMDLLFAEDEGVLPTAPCYSGQAMPLPQPTNPSPTRTGFSMPRPDVSAGDSHSMHSDDSSHEHGVARQRLRRQLSLLSKGWAGDEIRFKNCDPSKAVVLHNLAMELGLGYNHDVRSREVSMCRLEPAQAPSRPQLPSGGRLSSSPPRSSTELDSTRCLPGMPMLPDVPEYQIPDFAGSFSQQSTEHFAGEAQPSTGTHDQSLKRRLSRTERISDSISKHVSTLKTSIAKGGRRGPLTENGRRDMRALEGAGGACWRCKVLRRKCDLGSPCRCCLQSVPMPHLGEDAPLWPLIGCRRGPLRDSVTPQVLCPRLHRPRSGGIASISRRCRSVDSAGRCLVAAESQRLADMKAVLEGATSKLSITDPTLNRSFCLFVEAGRYRDRDSLHRGWSPGGKSVTYTELIATIAWELAENQALLPLLEIKSWESFMSMLETACVYESEVGQTSLVILTMVCFRHCLEALRLHSVGLLTPGAHEDCSGGQCQVECIRNLSSQLATYIDELSAVIFNKENMRDRRWWLSTFYSLFIQSYVRHALIAIEKQLRFRSPDDVPLEDLTATQYLHLPAVLFMAASAKYDPLLDGRLQYALTENSVITETSVPELHHAAARMACEVDKWPEFGIRTPYQFLRRLLQIGSLDFSVPSPDTSGPRSPMALGTPSSARGQVGSPIFPSPGPADSPMALPRPNYLGRNKRDSLDSRYSTEPSTIFSNQSSDSLARTMSTEMTSLYEPSIFTGVPFSDSLADLNSRMPTDIGTINPSALFPTKHNGSMQSLDQLVVESSVHNQGPGPTSEPTFVCNCCPRAPRYFHTKEELSNHEAEKPHPCTQCKKRFKSPTEAERHINAIHLKSDYWSCKTLEDPMLAFHSQTYHGAVWDVCGFCGGEFPRVDGAANRQEMVTHVQSTHRIGECDHGKKFYRADNFRQHLKNTHVALPGKWLKMLETACRSSRGPMYNDE